MTWPLLEVIDCLARRAVVPHAGNASGPLRRRRRRRNCAGADGIRWRAGWPDCSPPTPASVRSCSSTGWTANAQDLDADLAWQPELWRALVERVDADPPHIRHQKTVARLREGPTDLPARLSLFGHTRLACTDIELLDALSTHHDLHLWLPHPSDELWQALAGIHGAMPRRDDTSHRAVDHPLLADARPRPARTATRPAGRSADRRISRPGGEPTPTHCWAGCSPTSPPMPFGRRAARWPTDDRSVQVHSCHGPARQIDVLREVLLGLLAGRPDAGAARHPGDVPGHRDVCAADRRRLRARRRGARRAIPRTGCGCGSPTARSIQTNPLLGVASQLLALAGGRATASEVLNLAQAAPVRARFGFTDDDLEADHRWVRQANIRWGFDQEHRRPYGRRLRAQHLAFRHRPHPGRRRDVRRLARLDRTPRCRSTTSAATASNWPGSWPNSSTGCNAWSTRSPAHGR